MRILVFDTETTGLPKSRSIDASNLHLWPYIVQFSYIVYDTSSNTIINIIDEIVKIPDNVLIPEECVKIHGITNDICELRGKNIQNLLTEFYNYFNSCDRIVGHNLQFDLNMLKVELLRIMCLNTNSNSTIFLNMYEDVVKATKYYCTMQETITYCNLKALDKYGKEFVKYPKLSELHQKMFGNIPKHLHNSLIDVLVCLRCYVMWNHNIDIVETNLEVSSMMQLSL